MALTAGTLSQSSVSGNSVSLATTPATGGTGPYTEAYYYSTTTGFTPGPTNIAAGASGLNATVSGLTPNTNYFFKTVYTDTGNGNVTITSNQVASSTAAPTLNINAFKQSPFLGMVDLRFNYNTVSAVIDSSNTVPLFAGAAVKLVPQSTSHSVPKVIGIAAATDEVFGYINFDIKTQMFVAGNACEISQAGNVIYLYSTAAITQGTQVCSSLITMGGVAAVTGSSNANIVGWAYDGAAAAGALMRVRLTAPSFSFD